MHFTLLPSWIKVERSRAERERHSMGSSLTRLIDAGTDEVYGVRVEPKVFLANERTFLNWLRLSVTLGSIAAVCVCMCVCVRACHPGR